MPKSKRDAAIEAWAAAMNQPDAADWRSVADALRECLPMPKAKPEARPEPSAVYAPWHDNERPHKLRRGNGKRTIVVQFVDGRQTRASASDEGKFNIGRAVRVACTFYRHQVHRASLPAYAPNKWGVDRNYADSYVEHIPVAEILSVRCETYGDEFDPWIANRETKEYRAAGETPAERKARADKGAEAYAAAVEESRRMREEARVPTWQAIWERQPERDTASDLEPEPVDSEPSGVDLEPSPVDWEPLTAPEPEPEPEPEAPKVGDVLLAWQSKHQREADVFLALVNREATFQRGREASLALVRGQREAVAALAPQSVAIPPAPVAAPVRPPVTFQRRMGARALRMAATAGVLPAWGTVVVSLPVSVGA